MNVKRSSSNKYTIKFMKDEWAKKDCILITKIYEGCNNEMEFICNKHPKVVQSTSWSLFKKSKNGCIFCAGRRTYIDDFIFEFTKYNFLILIDEIDWNKVNNSTQIPCICIHHSDIVQHKKYGNMSMGQAGCPHCSGLVEHTIEEARELFDKNGFILLEDVYENSHKSMKCVCKKHPDKIQYRPFKSFLARPNSCFYCGHEGRKGENAWNWKGGKLSLNEYLKHNITQWKFDSAKNCNFKCVLTGENMNVIHHLYSFSKIVDETLKELNLDFRKNTNLYTDEELKLITDKCLEIHYRYPLGVCLTKEVHKEFHKKYGYKKNIVPEMFYEFVSNYNK